MFFTLTTQAYDILINKYKVKKRIIKKIELQINILNIIKDGNDYFNIIELILKTYSNLKMKVKEFSNGKDKLISTITLDDIVDYEIRRKYGEDIFSKRQLLKKK